MSRWFRHYAGMMRDEKLVRVSIKSKQPIERVLWLWGAILESAAEIDDDGRFDLDPAEAAYFLRADETDIHAVLAAFVAAERVAGDHVVHWGDRQFTSDRSATRVAAHRERKRAENRQSNVTETKCNSDVTLQGRHGNSPETETELETEEEVAKATPSPRAPAKPKVDLPEWLPAQPWADFLEMRGTIKSKPTANAASLLIRKLDELRGRGHDPTAVLEQSTRNSWKDLYEIKDQGNGAANWNGRRTGAGNGPATGDALGRVLHRQIAEARSRDAACETGRSDAGDPEGFGDLPVACASGGWRC